MLSLGFFNDFLSQINLSIFSFSAFFVFGIFLFLSSFWFEAAPKLNWILEEVLASLKYFVLISTLLALSLLLPPTTFSLSHSSSNSSECRWGLYSSAPPYERYLASQLYQVFCAPSVLHLLSSSSPSLSLIYQSLRYINVCSKAFFRIVHLSLSLSLSHSAFRLLFSLGMSPS